jgi:hypothetical protein
MPILKLSLTKEEEDKLSKLSKDENLSMQDYIRYLVFGNKISSKFTPEEAERRALEKFTAEDPPFTVPDIYGKEEWAELPTEKTGVFGKRCFNYFKTSDCTIKYVGTPGRRATYRITK